MGQEEADLNGDALPCLVRYPKDFAELGEAHAVEAEHDSPSFFQYRSFFPKYEAMTHTSAGSKARLLRKRLGSGMKPDVRAYSIRCLRMPSRIATWLMLNRVFCMVNLLSIYLCTNQHFSFDVHDEKCRWKGLVQRPLAIHMTQGDPLLSFPRLSYDNAVMNSGTRVTTNCTGTVDNGRPHHVQCRY